jgi:hypothetical protein
MTRSDAAVRASAFAAATLLVLALIAAALLTRFIWTVRELPPPAVSIISSWPSTPETSAAPSGAPQQRAAMRGTMAAPIPDAASQAAPGTGGLFGLRCATAEGRRAHPELCAGDTSYAARGAGDIAPERVEGNRTNEGAAQRVILRAAQARVTEYARGEAQRYIDPRQDPLYEDNTDPVTAAHRPCPEGQTPVGDGRGLNGQTCRPR